MWTRCVTCAGLSRGAIRSSARSRGGASFGALRRSSIEPDQLRPQRELPRDTAPVHEAASDFRLCWQAISKRWMMLLATAAGVLTVAMLATTRPSVSAGRSFQAPATAAHADVSRAPAGWSSAGSGQAALGSTGAGVNGTETCRPANSSNGYVNRSLAPPWRPNGSTRASTTRGQERSPRWAPPGSHT